MKKVKVILGRPKGIKKRTEAYKEGLNDGQWLGAAVAGIPSLILIITLLIMLAKQQ